MNSESTLGKRIREARGNMSQDMFCALAGVSKGSLGFYERDENVPRLDTAARICEVSGKSLAWLAGMPRDSGGGVVELPISLGLCDAAGFVLSSGKWDALASRLRGIGPYVACRIMATGQGPGLEPGDVLIVDTGRKELSPGVTYAIGLEGFVYFCNVWRRPGKLILDMGEKVECPADGGGVEILGRVAMLERCLEPGRSCGLEKGQCG